MADETLIKRVATPKAQIDLGIEGVVLAEESLKILLGIIV